MLTSASIIPSWTEQLRDLHDFHRLHDGLDASHGDQIERLECDPFRPVEPDEIIVAARDHARDDDLVFENPSRRAWGQFKSRTYCKYPDGQRRDVNGVWRTCKSPSCSHMSYGFWATEVTFAVNSFIWRMIEGRHRGSTKYFRAAFHVENGGDIAEYWRGFTNRLEKRDCDLSLWACRHAVSPYDAHWDVIGATASMSYRHIRRVMKACHDGTPRHGSYYLKPFAAWENVPNFVSYVTKRERKHRQKNWVVPYLKKGEKLTRCVGPLFNGYSVKQYCKPQIWRVSEVLDLNKS